MSWVSVLRVRALLGALFGALFFLLVAAPPSALAQAPDAAKAAEARRHLAKGEQLAAAKKWPEALAEFEKAHEAHPTGRSALRVADAHYAMDHLLPAYHGYDKALRSYGSELSGYHRAVAQQRFSELEGKTGAITIRVDQAGAEVLVDGSSVGTSPLDEPVRVEVGPHLVEAKKEELASSQVSVKIEAGEDKTVELTLQSTETTGRIEVTVKDEAELTVVIDGQEVGPAPYRGELEPGSHQVSGSSATQAAPEQSVEIKAGEEVTVELVAAPRDARIEVRVVGEKGVIFIDDAERGTGSAAVDVLPGEHVIRVTQDGFEPFEKTVELASAQVHAETVTLRRTAVGQVEEEIEEAFSFDGVYGGLHLGAIWIPTGSGSSPETSCDALGATSCDVEVPFGGNVSGYVGYAIQPVGMELYLTTAFDMVKPVVHFDGKTGSEINPLVAAPARDEEFMMARVGGGGALRVRVLFPFSFFRLTAAAGVGLSYKHVFMTRDTTAQTGATERYVDDVGYFSPVLSGELAGQFHVHGSTAVVVGLQTWLETAGDEATTEPDPKARLTGHDLIPAPLATPGYDVATGAQFYLGPVVGFQWGP